MERMENVGRRFGKCVKRIVEIWRAGTIGVRMAIAAIPVIGAAGIFLGSIALFSTSGKTTSLGLKNIGELATQAGYYTNVEVIEGSKELWGWSVPFTQSRYIFSYDGIIKAGIDFAEIEVAVNELTYMITVKMPEIRVLSNEIAADSLEVYDESRSIFTPLTLDTVNAAQDELRKEAEKTAIENGLLDNARTNAETLIKGFLAGTYDMEEYSIIFE